jgi:hypothetical protein
VKHLKTDKRSHLGAEAIKMQSTIFGAACIEKARALKKKKEENMELWTDNDVEFQLGLENWEGLEAIGGVRPTRPKRLFHTWREEWEKLSIKTNDVVHEAKLLNKYGGMRWQDPDNQMMYVAESDNLEWRRGIGWCVLGMDELGELEAWPIKMLPSLIKVATQEVDLNVEMVNLSREKKAEKRKARSVALAAAAAAKRSKGRKGKRKRCESSDSDLSSDSGGDDDDDDDGD